jgi:type IV pilus assembly protein PilV
LLEILVSLLILSLGLLGIAGLQAATTSYKMNSWTRSSTAILVSDFADRVRANPTAAGGAFWEANGTVRYELKSTYSSQTSGALPSMTSVPNCLTVLCTPAQRAAYDLLQWRYSVRELLPAGAAWVEGGRTDGFNVTLMWGDKDYVGSNPNPQNPIGLTSPVCSSLTNPTAAEAASCCPAAAAAGLGVRCQSFFFIP